jgi:ubiquitin carboxyl-terminal hydrolase 1
LAIGRTTDVRKCLILLLVITSSLTSGLAQAGCQLEACLADYTRLELLTDCICRKCSLLATQKRLAQEAERLAEAMAADPNPSTSKKKRVKEAKKLETRVKLALEEGRIEDDIKGVKMDKVFSKASTKQAMIARVSFDSQYNADTLY